MARALSDIDAELADLRCRTKAERAAGCAAERAIARQWQLSERVRRVCLVVFDQAGGDTEPCAKYLEATGRICHWEPKEEHELRCMAEEVFLEAASTDAGVEAYAALVDLGNSSDVAAVREAVRHTEDWHVVQWARDQNVLKSLAPSTDQLLQHLEERRVRIPEAIRPSPRGTSLDAGARKWATRLRERWNGFVGRFKVRVELPLDEKRAKAFAAWQWWAHLKSKVTPAKPVIRVNLDETAIALHQGGTEGSVFVSKRKLQELVENVSTGKKRCYMTHIALICDRTDLQPRLPQVLVANEHTFRARDMAALRAACPPNVHLIRQKSAWSNQELCARVVRLLKEVVTAHAGDVQIVLLLDVCRVHMTDLVIEACDRPTP